MIASMLTRTLLLILTDLQCDSYAIERELNMALESHGPHSPIVEALQHKHDIALWAVECMSKDLDKAQADEIASLKWQKEVRERQEDEASLGCLVVAVGIVLMLFVCAFIAASQAGV